jgi:DNA repair protein RadC
VLNFFQREKGKKNSVKMMMMTNHILHDNSHQQQQIQSPQSIADYLAQLLKDRKQLAALPNVFTHLERLLDEGESKWKNDGIVNHKSE